MEGSSGREIRNLHCPRYEECLTEAAKKNLPELPCAGCQNRNLRGREIAVEKDIPGCLLLLMAVFEDRDPAMRRLWLEVQELKRLETAWNRAGHRNGGRRGPEAGRGFEAKKKPRALPFAGGAGPRPCL